MSEQTAPQLPISQNLENTKNTLAVRSQTSLLFSDYVVYVDESGDHNLEKINPEYPVFVLAFCIFHKSYYAEQVIPSIEKFKFKYFGHDAIVLHEHEIRKQKGSFSLLTDRVLREEFMNELTQLMVNNHYVLVSCVIDKNRLKKLKQTGDNPYHIALSFCLDGLRDFLAEKNQLNHTTHVLVECRGKKEDEELELEFRRLCDGNNRENMTLPFKAIFLDKKTNAVGLQLADLVARPIGIAYLSPERSNRAFDVLKQKFLCRDGRKYLGENYLDYGLKIVPQKA